MTMRFTAEHRRDLLVIGQAGIVDPQWYRSRYPDVAVAGVDPLEHFVTSGWREGRDPGPLFSVRHYLDAYPDVAAARLNPLTHYLEWGWREGRSPRPHFDAEAYAAGHGLGGGICPLVHEAARTRADGTGA